jgi:hypothetical protein
MAFSASLTDTQQVTAVVSGGVDKKGKPAPLDGLPTFASDDETVATFAADPRDPSGMTGLIVAIGPGSTTLSIKADARIGPETLEIIEPGAVAVSAGEAVGFAPVTVGTPEEQA